MPFDDGLVRLSREECMDLLTDASFGRVGVSVHALPAILPVSIAVIGERIIFRTIPGTKLAYAATGSILAVEVDEYDPARGEGWSVLVRGVATELTDAVTLARARQLLTDSWIGGDAAEHYIGVGCDLVTGRRLHREGDRDHPAGGGDLESATKEET